MNSKLLSIIAVLIGILLPMKMQAQWVANDITAPMFTFDGDNLVMTCETQGAVIYYAMSEYADEDQAYELLDNMYVTEYSEVYTQPIPIKTNVVVKAMARIPQQQGESELTTLIYSYTAYSELLSAIEYGSNVQELAQNSPLVSDDLKEQLQWALEEGQMIYDHRGEMPDSHEAEHFAEEILQIAHEIEEILNQQPSGPEPYAVLSQNNTVLTFYYDANRGAFQGSMDVTSTAWLDYREQITTVVFDASFADCTTLTSTSSWFSDCKQLTTIEGIRNLNTQNVTNMGSMFLGCEALTSLDVSHFNTEKVTDMSYMFSVCSALTNIDVSHFNTSHVTNMIAMFGHCSSLTSLDLSNFNTENVTNMLHMFNDCHTLTTLDLSSFNTANVTSMIGMFFGCAGLKTIYVSDSWSTSNVSEGIEVFYECNNLVGGRGTKFSHEHIDYTYAHIDGGTNNPGYFTRSGEEPWTEPTEPEPYAVLSDNNTVLTFYYDTNKERMNGMSVGPFEPNPSNNRYNINSGWDLQRENIISVVFDASFANCTTLKSTAYWFYGFTNLTSITGISNLKTDNVTNMEGVFSDCSSLTSLDVTGFKTDNVTSMLEMFYGCYSLTSLDVTGFKTDNVRSMHQMFAGCSSLTTIYASEGWSTESINYGDNMFEGCSNLIGGAGTRYDADHTDYTYAHIDGGAANPGYFTDKNAPANDNIQFADAKVKEICVANWDTDHDGELSYDEAAAVTSLGKVFSKNIDITSFNEFQYFTGVTSIGQDEFRECYGLNSLILPNSIQTIEREAFWNCRISEITIPASVTTIHYAALYSCFKNIYVDPDNKNYCSIDGVLFNKDVTTIVCYPVLRNEESYTIPNTVTIIGGCSFYGSSLKTVVIPNGVTIFENGAFRYCRSLENIIIPESVEVIETENFQYCSSLTTITIPRNVNSIAYDVLSSCSKLQEIIVDSENEYFSSSDGVLYSKDQSKLITYPAGKTNTSFLIPDQVTIIDTYSFIDCENLNEVSIPKGITSFGWAVFSGCKNLKSVIIFRKDPISVGKIFPDETLEEGTLYVPYGAKTLYEDTENWKDFRNIVEMEKIEGEAEPYAVLSRNNTVLTFYCDDKMEERGGISLDDDRWESRERELSSSIVALVFDESFSDFVVNEVEDFSIDLTGWTSLAAVRAGNVRIPAEEYAKVGNPNLLVYVDEPSLAPQGVQNVVVNGLAQEIILTDATEGNNNWHCPEPFRAERITYTRNFRQQTEVGISRGWESIALPFTVQTITHETQGRIIPFGAQGTGKYFWLRGYSPEGLHRATVLEANTPYVISMPNNPTVYPSEYNLNGRVTFSAENTTVPATPEFEEMLITRDNIRMAPVFQLIPRNEMAYAINVGQPLDRYAEGSVFTRELREVRPFEAVTYHEPVNGARPQNIRIAPQSDDDITGVRTIELDETEGTWYSIDGRQLQGQPQRKGVYLQKGKKIVVK